MSRSALLVFAVAAAVFFPLTGLGIWRSGFNPDEWLYAAGGFKDFGPILGRWAQDFIELHLLGGQVALPLQIASCFLLSLLTASLLARHAVAERFVHPATLAIFVIGVSHIYLAELLDWGMLIASNCLALFLSVWAMDLVWRDRGSRWRWVILLAAAQLLALSLANYQTFAVLGLMVPVLALIRVDAVSDRTLVKRSVATLFVAAGAVVLYKVELGLYARWADLDLGHPRFSVITPHTLLDKLSRAPWMEVHLLSGGLFDLPPVWQALTGLLPASILLAGAVAAALSLRNGTFAALRVVAGVALALFCLPVMPWFAVQIDWLPPRAIGYLGFVLGATCLAVATVLAAQLQNGRAIRAVAVASAVLLVGISVVQLAASQRFWHLMERRSARELSLTADIAEAVRKSGGDVATTPVAIAGVLAMSDLSFGGYTAESAYKYGNNTMSALKVAAGAGAASPVIPASAQPCPAFPAAGSVFRSGPSVTVCLQPFDRPIRPDRCYKMAGGSNGLACIIPGGLAIVTPDCSEGALWLDFTVVPEAGGQPVRYSRSTWGVPMLGACYRFLVPPIEILRPADFTLNSGSEKLQPAQENDPLLMSAGGAWLHAAASP
jgi:hypothetical protein